MKLKIENGKLKISSELRAMSNEHLPKAHGSKLTAKMEIVDKDLLSCSLVDL